MSNNIYLKKGLDIPLEGAAALNTRKVIAPDIIAVKPTDFRGACSETPCKGGR